MTNSYIIKHPYLKLFRLEHNMSKLSGLNTMSFVRLEYILNLNTVSQICQAWIHHVKLVRLEQLYQTCQAWTQYVSCQAWTQLCQTCQAWTQYVSCQAWTQLCQAWTQYVKLVRLEHVSSLSGLNMCQACQAWTQYVTCQAWTQCLKLVRFEHNISVVRLEHKISNLSGLNTICHMDQLLYWLHNLYSLYKQGLKSWLFKLFSYIEYEGY